MFISCNSNKYLVENREKEDYKKFKQEFKHHENKGDYKNAYETAISAVGYLENDEKKAYAYYKACIAAHKIGDLEKSNCCYAKSKSYYEKYIEANKNNFESMKFTYNDYARLLYYMGDMGEAKRFYLKALEIDNKYSCAHNNYAILLSYLDKIEEAREHFEKATEKEDGKFYNNYANFLFKIKENTEAKRKYKKAKKLSEYDAIIFNNCGVMYSELGELEKAEKNYKKSLNINNNYAVALNNYALLLSKTERKPSAKEHFERALEIEVDYSRAHNNYAILLNEIGQDFEANEHFRKAIHFDPNYFIAYINYGNFLMLQGKLCQAKEKIEKAGKIRPTDPLIFLMLGNILSASGYLDEAELKYKQALDYHLESKEIESRIHNNLGRIYAEKDQYDEAKREFKCAKSLDPSNKIASDNLNELNKTSDFPRISHQQIYVAGFLFLILLANYYLKLTDGFKDEKAFALIFTILISLIIFVIFFQHIYHLKVTSIEFKMFEQGPKSSVFATGKEPFIANDQSDSLCT
jgi:tetratricopeptide (TPR) repeat protein